MSFTMADWKVIGLKVIAIRRGIVANIPTPQNGGVFECSDNARLIGSAPDLYEACQRADRALDNAYNLIIGALEPDSLVAQDIAFIKAALAKADGAK